MTGLYCLSKYLSQSIYKSINIPQSHSSTIIALEKAHYTHTLTSFIIIIIITIVVF